MKPEHKKPCIALLGEFSAGKSTLANLLLGRTQSRVRVTATQVPPLWYQHGNGEPVRIRNDDTKEPLGPDADIAVAVEDTKVVHVPLDAPILERIDLLDMPGSSDPNMAPDVWDSLLPSVDIAIWCTPATQAWRQSEAAIWDNMPDAVQNRSMMLLTRFDKVRMQDQTRVLKRVRTEVAGQFRHVLPAALLAKDAAGRSPALKTIIAALDDLIENAVPKVVAPVEASRAQIPKCPPRPLHEAVTPRRVTALSAGTKSKRRSGPSALF
ncbi:dynamin family protein [Gymnodinialimonas hymeniacidonis]|uniref:dynamin family protein n=1 Tax=Gymnodinialimonas hymeniacidonis TaxID=3126508 RepID=UPI0034C5F590